MQRLNDEQRTMILASHPSAVVNTPGVVDRLHLVVGREDTLKHFGQGCRFDPLSIHRPRVS
jgi:hypothetical protein